MDASREAVLLGVVGDSDLGASRLARVLGCQQNVVGCGSDCVCSGCNPMENSSHYDERGRAGQLAFCARLRTCSGVWPTGRLCAQAAEGRRTARLAACACHAGCRPRTGQDEDPHQAFAPLETAEIVTSTLLRPHVLPLAKWQGCPCEPQTTARTIMTSHAPCRGPHAMSKRAGRESSRQRWSPDQELLARP